jgi:hypothetical protein
MATMEQREKQNEALDALVEKLDTGEKIDGAIGTLIKGVQRAEAEVRLGLARAAMAGEAESVRHCRAALDSIAEYYEVIHQHPVVVERLKVHKEKQDEQLSELGRKIVGAILK